jgi:S-formylglutathione hydrolase FrmB
MMRRSLFSYTLLLAIFCHVCFLRAQPIAGDPKETAGTIRKSLPFFSHAVNDTICYSLYLPQGYYSTHDSFPVLYLLHGLGGDENSWISDFSVDRITDSITRTGAMPPLIIVMPDGRKSYYINDYRNVFPYETFFIREFIPFIDSAYRTKGSKSFRAIGGLSMGGYGAIINACRHPGCFSAVVALSAAIRTDSMIINENETKYNLFFRPLFGDSIKQYKKVSAHWIEYNPLYLTQRQPDTLKSVAWYIDCGFNDYLLPGNEALHGLYIRSHIPHEYHVRPGYHDKLYWNTALIPALLFTAKVFKDESEEGKSGERK